MNPQIDTKELLQSQKNPPGRLRLKRKQHRDGVLTSFLKMLHLYPEKTEQEPCKNVPMSGLPIKPNLAVPKSAVTIASLESIGYSSLFENISTAELCECKRVTLRRV